MGEEFPVDPIGDFFGFRIERVSGFKEVGQVFAGRQKGAVVVGQGVLFHVPRFFDVRHFGQRAAHCFDPLFTDFDGSDIGIGEVEIISGVFFGAHGETAVLKIVPAPGFLDKLFCALFESVHMTVVFIVDGPGNGFERVHVFDFCANAEFRRSGFAHGYVDVGPHGAFFHFAVGDAGIPEDSPQFLQIGQGFVCGTEIRVADNFDQGNAGSVIVNQTLVGVRVMQEFACVFFDMDLLDPDGFGAGFGAGGAGGCDVYMAFGTDWGVKLCDLIGCGQIGIVIVFFVEGVAGGDAAVGDKSGGNGQLDGSFVEDGQKSGHTAASGTDVFIGFGSERGGAGAEEFGLGGHFYMDFKTHDQFIAHGECLLILLYDFVGFCDMRFYRCGAGFADNTDRTSYSFCSP